MTQQDSAQRQPRVDDDTTKTAAKLLTMLGHIAAATVLLAVFRAAPSYSGKPIFAINICAAHWLLLAGAWGPKRGDCAYWWVPSPVKEPMGVLLLLILGFVEFMLIAILTFRDQEYHTTCSEALVRKAEFVYPMRSFERMVGVFQTNPELKHLFDDPLSALVSTWYPFGGLELACNANTGCLSRLPGFNSTLSHVTQQMLALAGCTTVPFASFVPDCLSTSASCSELLPLEACPFKWLREWQEATPLANVTSIKDVLVSDLAAESCAYKQARDQYVVEWTYVDSTWFCFVLLTTVGYGNTFYPSSPLSRMFVLLWATYGLVIFGAASSMVIESVSTLLSWSTHQLTVRSRLGTAVASTPTRDGAGPKEAQSAQYAFARGLYLNFIAFLALNFGGAYIFMRLEDGWAFSDALYHCLMTATTIGLGDLAPQTSAGRVYGIVQMVLSVALLGSLMGTILNSVALRKQSLKKQEMLARQVDAELLASLDRNGDGVDKTEFVLGMLEIMGVVNEADYAPFLEQFEKLDKTRDGRLTRSDLLDVADLNRQRQQQKAEAACSQSAATKASYRERCEGHALELCVPTFIACFAFAWNCLFGYLLLAAGLLHGLAIGCLLGSPMESSSSYYKVICLVAAGASCFAGFISLIVYYVADPAEYLKIDSTLFNQAFGDLDANGLTPHTSPHSVTPETWGRLRESVHDTYFLMLISVYVALFVYAFLADLATMICCFKAAAEVSAEVLEAKRCSKPCAPERTGGIREAKGTSSSQLDMASDGAVTDMRI